jgi:AmiR/NasT family two-component response regulator
MAAATDGRRIRTAEEECLIARAKEYLMGRRWMTEPQAHRFLLDQAMNQRMRLVEAARAVLATARPERE